MTNDDVMAESRRLALFMAALLLAVFVAYVAQSARLAAVLALALSGVYAAAGISRSFAARVALMGLGTAGLLLIGWAKPGSQEVVLLLFAICGGELYRLIKYRDVTEEPLTVGSDSPFETSEEPVHLTWKTMAWVLPIGVVVAVLLNQCVERASEDWTKELARKSGDARK